MFSECIFLPIHVCRKFLYKHFFFNPSRFRTHNFISFASVWIHWATVLDNGAEQERNKEKNVFLFILNESNLQNKIVPFLLIR